MHIKGRRAEEIEALCKWWGKHRTAMLSLTIRHGMGDDLARIRRGIGRACSALQRGKPWERFKARVGLRAGFVAFREL